MRSQRAAILGTAITLLLLSLSCRRPESFSRVSGALTGDNPISIENRLAGSPSSEWELAAGSAGDPGLQGFATDISFNRGQTVNFKISSAGGSPYHIEIYRMGYYGGAGARHVASVVPLPAVQQPACLCMSNWTSPPANCSTTSYPADCSNWSVSASWASAPTQVSGIYFAKLTNNTNPSITSHIVFVIRDDSSTSGVLFQTSDATWQAYNGYGGYSLYPINNPPAFKVSYNRPFATAALVDGNSWVFATEYRMVRWLESNGYDVSYTTGVDGERRGNLIANHRVFLSVGHDEYWSGAQRTSVEAARDAGVNLAFFSGNEMFWKTRWESDASGAAYRTLVSYKSTHDNAQTDPSGIWTGSWRDPRFSPPADGGRPENAVTGTLFAVDGIEYDSMNVSSTEGKLRFWRATPTVSSLPSGGTATLTAGCNCVLGYEWDEAPDNGYRPSGLIALSTTVRTVAGALIDYGSNYRRGQAKHSLTLYRHPSGSLVFSTGTANWAWGLDGSGYVVGKTSAPDADMQQATVNLLADMGQQPVTLQSNLAQATGSTDSTRPMSQGTVPSSATINVPVTLTFTATDVGGMVAGIEVSADGGVTWHPAVRSGAAGQWSWTWISARAGQALVRSRAIDDSGNIEAPAAGSPVNVSSPPIAHIFSDSESPTRVQTSDGGAATGVQLGVHFYADVSGTATGVRFFNPSSDTGTYVGKLWDSAGSLLASATFPAVNSTGWKDVSFSTPVHLAANTLYTASYLTTGQHYAYDPTYFGFAAIDRGVLHAIRDHSYSIWSPDSRPASISTDAQPVELGVKFRSDVAGLVTGIRFYKGSANTGTHVGHLWTSEGTLLATATFSAESGSGWQQVSIPATAIAANTTYVASYHTNTGHFANDIGYFSSAGKDNVPLHALRDGSSGPNSVYAYGSTSAFPTQSASSQNYWVDVVFAPGPSGASSNGVYSYDNPGTTAPALTNSSANYWADVNFVADGALTSIWGPAYVPSTISSDAQPVELGVKFRSDVSGRVVGLRFYKGATNTGTHIGNIWRSTGSLLGTAVFTNESPSGWQQVLFSSPVVISPNTTYVASYHTNTGHFADNISYFSSSGFDNPPLHALRNGQDGPNGLYAYSANTVFPTNTNLSQNYWVDVAFDSNPGSIWASSATPSTISSDAQPVELGLKFRSDVTGFITGIRFYKGASNIGPHVGSLWTANGTLLASATFVGETTAGWQQVTFAAPVAISSNTTYVASYHTNTGHFADDFGYFASSGHDNAPLHALKDGQDGPNGLYAYSASSVFPMNTHLSQNYWVDVVFSQ
jgi:hypothetical protein